MSDRPRESDPPEAVYPRFTVEVVEGADVGKRVMAEGTELQIGTAASNEMVLTDGTVSRHHCVIRVTADGFSISDLDSMNGVKLGGVRVTEAVLKEQCTIRLGRVKLSFARVDGIIREKLSTTRQFGSLVGDSPAMRRIFARCRRVSQTDRGILLVGESGSGKRTLAEGIHQESPRSSEPFLALDLLSLATAELEPALFGPEGALGRAGKGTVYLASVGSLPLELQEILVETYDSHEARLIAGATHDLRARVNRGRFRADLYHRVAATRVFIPPLRDRPEDVPVLVKHLFHDLYPGRLLPPDEFIGNCFTKRHWQGDADALRAAIIREVGAPTGR